MTAVQVIRKNLFSQSLIKSAYEDCSDVLVSDQFKKLNQFSLTSQLGNDIFQGVGSLYDYGKQEFHSHTSEFQTFNERWSNSSLQAMYDLVIKNTQAYDVKIGRVRFMRLLPKTCLTYHRDPEEFRFHVPLTTNEKCFFVNKDKVYWMAEVGSLYLFNTRELHTAVNASFEYRDHLVFDTYKL